MSPVRTDGSGDAPSRRWSRRDVLGWAVVAGGGGLLAACGSRVSAAPAHNATVTLAGQLTGVQTAQLLVAVSAVPLGRGELTVGLLTPLREFVQGGTARIWLGRRGDLPPVAGYRAPWYALSAAATSGDRSPRNTLPGFYAVPVQTAAPGQWIVAATVGDGTHRIGGLAPLEVSATTPARVGTRALASPTPVANTAAEAARICTREPPDALHAISLADAVRSGRPTVVCFATPLLCESRMCAPVLDEVIALAAQVGPGRVNFIHVEEFPTRDENQPAPAFVAWGFRTEPWTVVIDAGGVITASFEGPVNAAQLRAVLPA